MFVQGMYIFSRNCKDSKILVWLKKGDLTCTNQCSEEKGIQNTEIITGTATALR